MPELCKTVDSQHNVDIFMLLYDYCGFISEEVYITSKLLQICFCPLFEAKLK